MPRSQLPMDPRVRKRSVVIGGHKTSVSLEEAFWSAIRELAIERGLSMSAMIEQIDNDKQQSNLSSAIRLFVLEHYRTRGPPEPADDDAGR
jgi:predicted DNA-binding ribbon-helix-helix protein